MGNSKGVDAVFAVVAVAAHNTGDNAAGLLAGHTDVSGRESESGAAAAAAIAHPGSHKNGRAVT